MSEHTYNETVKCQSIHIMKPLFSMELKCLCISLAKISNNHMIVALLIYHGHIITNLTGLY